MTKKTLEEGEKIVEEGREETLSERRERVLMRCSEMVTPDEYVKALGDLSYVHPESKAVIKVIKGDK